MAMTSAAPRFLLSSAFEDALLILLIYDALARRMLAKGPPRLQGRTRQLRCRTTSGRGRRPRRCWRRTVIACHCGLRTLAWSRRRANTSEARRRAHMRTRVSTPCFLGLSRTAVQQGPLRPAVVGRCRHVYGCLPCLMLQGTTSSSIASQSHTDAGSAEHANPVLDGLHIHAVLTQQHVQGRPARVLCRSCCRRGPRVRVRNLERLPRRRGGGAGAGGHRGGAAAGRRGRAAPGAAPADLAGRRRAVRAVQSPAEGLRRNPTFTLLPTIQPGSTILDLSASLWRVGAMTSSDLVPPYRFRRRAQRIRSWTRSVCRQRGAASRATSAPPSPPCPPLAAPQSMQPWTRAPMAQRPARRTHRPPARVASVAAASLFEELLPAGGGAVTGGVLSAARLIQQVVQLQHIGRS